MTENKMEEIGTDVWLFKMGGDWKGTCTLHQ